MAATLFSFVIVTFSLSLQQLATANGIHVEVNPQKCISSVSDLVHISCSPGDVIDTTKDITLIEIIRNDQDPIAFVRDCSNVTFGAGTPDRIQAVGHIDKDPSQSYLYLTVLKPKSEDTGVYTCVIYYVDQGGHVIEERASGDLVVEKLNMDILENVIDKLKDQIDTLETRAKNIEDGGEEKVSSVSAFSATRDPVVYQLSSGSVVVFPYVLLQLGSGYDASTGVFTAPIKGLYVFSLSIRLDSSNHRISIDLKANNEVVISLYAGDSNFADQSSITSLVHLDVGDQVKPVVGGVYGTDGYRSNPFAGPADSHNFFSGYLVARL